VVSGVSNYSRFETPKNLSPDWVIAASSLNLQLATEHPLREETKRGEAKREYAVELS
jgi:hypothetical protein